MLHPTVLNKTVFSIIKDIRILVLQQRMDHALCTTTSENYDVHSGNNNHSFKFLKAARAATLSTIKFAAILKSVPSYNGALSFQ